MLHGVIFEFSDEQTAAEERNTMPNMFITFLVRSMNLNRKIIALQFVGTQNYFFHPRMRAASLPWGMCSLECTMCLWRPKMEIDAFIENGEESLRVFIWVKYRLASLDRIVKSSLSTTAAYALPLVYFVFRRFICFVLFPSYRCRLPARNMFHLIRESLVWWKLEINRCTDRRISWVFHIISVSRRHNSYTYVSTHTRLRTDGLDANTTMCVRVCVAHVIASLKGNYVCGGRMANDRGMVERIHIRIRGKKSRWNEWDTNLGLGEGE